jgi:hypothetical protein
VICQAAQDLVGTTDPVLAGGYKVMTLLDPHPTNNNFAPLDYSAGGGATASSLAAILRNTFQAKTMDPQVVIPPNIDAASSYFQHNPASAFSGVFNIEVYINPWGEAPGLIINRSSAPLVSVDLTNRVDPDLGPFGHIQIPPWYEKTFVRQGAILSPYSS